jgi:thioredoxin:protein disulfide reductase
MSFLRFKQQTLRLWMMAFWVICSVQPVRAAEFLEPALAFQGAARVLNAKTLEVSLEAAPQYYLYRERLTLALEGAEAQIDAPRVPAGEKKFDETFQKTVEVLRGKVLMQVPIKSAANDFRVRVSYQGCADQGLCYPPQTALVSVTASQGQMTQASWREDTGRDSTGRDSTGLGGVLSDLSGNPSGSPLSKALSNISRLTINSTPNAWPSAVTTPAAEAVSTPAAEAARVESALKSGNLLTIAGVFLLAGVLLAFTPCVLPMVPILSSIIVGQGAPVSRGRGFMLALVYALGMALVYTAFGILAGLLGEGLAAALQTPWVLGAFSLLLLLLSLAMFGVFELQMPSFIQTRLTTTSSRLSGGKLAGVFAMGGLSALIVGPCIAAPLAGALVFISQTKDVVVGGVALFSLAMGMSVPLLLVGISAGALLPRAGAWMEGVKTFFGVLLLGVALWLVAPVLPGWAVMLLAGAVLLIVAVYLRLLDATPATAPASALQRLVKGVALVLAVLGSLQLVGALSGGSNIWLPLQHLARGAAAGSNAVAATEFRRIRNVAELDAVLQTANRPVMLDFYADWCVACKEMEHRTFSDPSVRMRMSQALLLQADLTANTADDKALLKRFGLFGPPGILFFNAQGQELPNARVLGFSPPSQFATALSAAGL